MYKAIIKQPHLSTNAGEVTQIYLYEYFALLCLFTPDESKSLKLTEAEETLFDSFDFIIFHNVKNVTRE